MKIYSRLFITSIIVLGQALSLLSCSYSLIPFCQSVDQLSNHVVVTGTVQSVDQDGIDFQVRDVLRGEENRDVIRIWDGTDFDCNGPFSMAAADLGTVGTELVLVLPLIDSLENTWDVLGDYRRPTYFGPTTRLEIEDNFVVGYMTLSSISGPFAMQDTVSYENFVAAWGADLDCSQLSVSTTEPDQAPVVWHGSHVTDLLYLEFASADYSRKSVQIYDINGQLVHGCSITADQWEVDTSYLSSGMYVLCITSEGSLPYTSKILKS